MIPALAVLLGLNLVSLVFAARFARLEGQRARLTGVLLVARPLASCAPSSPDNRRRSHATSREEAIRDAAAGRAILAECELDQADRIERGG